MLSARVTRWRGLRDVSGMSAQGSRFRVIIGVLAALVVASPAFAQSPISFAGKKISVSIGFSPVGIGYDTYGRVLARYMPKYLPGDRKSTRLNSSHIPLSRMPSSA